MAIVDTHVTNSFVSPIMISLIFSYCVHMDISVLEATVRLIDAGACINILNNDGHSPLCYLIEKQDISTITQVLPYLLEKGADPSLGDDLPLIVAASLNQTTTTNMLLEHGVDVDRKNSRGNTALTTILDLSKGQKVVAYIYYKN